MCARRILVLTSLGAVVALAAACDDGGGATADAAPPLPEVTDPLEWVDPTIGTGGFGFAHGSAFVGAVGPHGLAKLGPDTAGPHGTINFLHYSGYWAGDDRLQAITHTHLHGTGATDYGVLAVMPATSFDPAETSVLDHEAAYAKADERARPGHYTVTLDSGVKVELTARGHAGRHRWTFPAAATEAWAVFDLAKTLSGGEVTDAEIAVDAAMHEVTGRMHHRGGMSGGFGGYDLWFVVRAERAWSAQRVWSGGAAAADGVMASGTGVGFALAFDPAAGPVELVVGLSLVGPEGARAHLDAAVAAGGFDAMVAAVETEWRALTGAVLVTGGSPAERRMFYTALYHAYLMPTQVGDQGGSYRVAGHAPTLTGTHRHFSELSLWDTYRTLHPLYVLLTPASARDSVRSMLAFARTAGFFPRWPIATGEAGTMLGASADIVVADAAVKDVGLGAAELAEAWGFLRAAALDATPPPGGRGTRQHVEIYDMLGYVPAENAGRSVSLTTEFAHDDFALAEWAAAQGLTDDQARLRDRSRGWRLLFDPATGFLRARHADGSLAGPADFDPLELIDDYAEANAWHSLWMAGAHDAAGLAELFGSSSAAVAKLETFFTEADADWQGTLGNTAAAALPRPYYWHGNEPDMNAAYLFAQLGRPDLTQRWVRWIMDHLYTDGPEGLAGNDDGGTLSAWYVFSALGFYPVPGSAEYVVGAPRFPRARVLLPGGGELVVEAPDVSAERPYVQAVTLNGVSLDEPRLTHAELVAGGTLRFEMGAEPSAWGRSE